MPFVLQRVPRTRQPQEAVRMHPEWAKGALLSYPRIGIGEKSAVSGKAPISGIADASRFALGKRGQGLTLNGDGSSASSAKGAYNTAGDLLYRGLAALSYFTVVEFSSLASAGEAAVFRATGTANAKGIAFDIFPNTKTLRPLIHTNGTTGFTTLYDEVDSALTTDVLWGLGFSYASGSRVTYSGPIGGKPTTWTRSAITGTVNDDSGSNGAVYIGGMLYSGGATIAFPGHIYTETFWDKLLSAGDFERLFAQPWQQYEDEEVWVWVPAAGAGAALAADAQASASGSGSLSTGIPVAAAALSIASASGSLTTQIPLTGSAAVVSAASGQLTAAITLAGSALAQAIAGAAMSSGIILTANAVAQAAAQGSLDSVIRLISNATASASASGDLTGGGSGAALAGDAAAMASATGSITVQIQLSAAALAQALAQAGLSNGIVLAGDAQGQAAASGSLGAQAALVAAAIAEAGASGTLSAQIQLGAAALAQALGNGQLTTRIDLEAFATATASAPGTMAGAPLVVDPDYVVALPARQFRVALPRRVYSVALAARDFTVRT